VDATRPAGVEALPEVREADGAMTLPDTLIDVVCKVMLVRSDTGHAQLRYWLELPDSTVLTQAEDHTLEPGDVLTVAEVKTTLTFSMMADGTQRAVADTGRRAQRRP
jgi:hypothetical protein